MLYNEFLLFFKAINLSKFVELDFRYLDFSKYMYFEKSIENMYKKYMFVHQSQPNYGISGNGGFGHKMNFINKSSFIYLYDY